MTAEDGESVRLLNPLSASEGHLRAALLPGSRGWSSSLGGAVARCAPLRSRHGICSRCAGGAAPGVAPRGGHPGRGARSVALVRAAAGMTAISGTRRASSTRCGPRRTGSDHRSRPRACSMRPWTAAWSAAPARAPLTRHPGPPLFGLKLQCRSLRRRTSATGRSDHAGLGRDLTLLVPVRCRRADRGPAGPGRRSRAGHAAVAGDTAAVTCPVGAGVSRSTSTFPATDRTLEAPEVDRAEARLLGVLERELGVHRRDQARPGAGVMPVSYTYERPDLRAVEGSSGCSGIWPRKWRAGAAGR